MKSKSETSLNEQDALTDMLETEKSVLLRYATALAESSAKSLRNEILKHYSAAAESQFSVFEAMHNRGYYDTTVAEQSKIAEAAKSYKETKAAIAQ